jgi:hypothetical protein
MNNMNFNTSMPATLRPYFDKELRAYYVALQENKLQQAWRHLEKAHVIGQAYPFQHSYVHWKMLQFGIKIKSLKEVTGQIPRLLIGGVKSFVGKIPVGNTGGANIPPLKSLTIEQDIIEIFQKAGVELPK